MLPEYGLHALLTLMMFLSLNWTAFLLNLPLLAYHVYLFQRNDHLYDPTEIFPRLFRKKVEGFAKMAFFLLFFFYYLYRLVVALVSTDIHYR